MIYQSYPEKCLPTELTPSGAVFPDGVYQDVHNIDDGVVQVIRTSTGNDYYGTYTYDFGIISQDAPVIPSNTFMSGIRRVRAPSVAVQCAASPAHTDHSYLISYVLTLCVRRHGQGNNVLTRDVLANAYGNRVSRIAASRNAEHENSEDLNIVYPGTVELNSGDDLVLRLNGVVTDLTGGTSAGGLLAKIYVSVSYQAFVKFL